MIFRKPLYVLSFDEDTAMTAGVTRSLDDKPLYDYHRGCDCSDDANRRVSSSISRYCTASVDCTRVSSKFNGVIIGGIIISLIGFFAGLSASYIYEAPPEPRLHVCS